MSKVRILHCLETISSGGVERRRLSLAKYLNRQNYEFKIICTQAKGNIAEEIRAEGIEIIEIGKLKSIFDYKQHKKIQKIIDTFKPDIIHGAVFEGVTMAAINGFAKNVPIIILEETSDPQNRSWKGNLLMKAFSKVADKVVGVSPAATEYLKSKLRIPLHKVELIDNGVAVPRFVDVAEKNLLREELGILTGEIIIGSTGRMHKDEHKRFSDLIKAFKIVVARGVNAKLVLVGDGRERLNYERLAKDLNVFNRVIFAGYQGDVAKYYSIFDIFSLVSAYEAFGLVIAEAMLHHLPVVVTKEGGMKYIVEDAITGLFVERYNVNDIANKLYDLCIDSNKARKMGEAGYVRAMSNYTEERYVNQVDQLYSSFNIKI